MSENEEEEDKTTIQQPFDFNSLKAGEYTLHLYIEETRNLVSSDSESSLDPMIKAEVFGNKKYSEVKKQRGTAMIFWGEHQFFETKINNSAELEVMKMKVSIMDYNRVVSNSLVGNMEIDLLSIYFSENHALLHQWVAISNTDKDYQKITGFIKFSAQLYTQGDTQVLLKEEEVKTKGKIAEMGMNCDNPNDEFNFGGVEMILPPQMKTVSHILKITLIRAENLIDMDTFGSIDPFVTFEFGSSRYKTKKINDNQNPIWGKVICLPYSEPMISQSLGIKMFDYDLGRSDELIASCQFMKTDILSGRYKNAFWVNLYGAQKGNSNSDKRMTMNSVPDLGTFWKGRMLMKIESEKMDKPKQSVTQLPDEIMRKYLQNSNMEWQVNADIFYGIEFADDSASYSVMIRLADQELEFPAVDPDKGVWKWFQFQKKVFTLPYKDSRELPDVFIYLVKDGRKTCLVRKPFKFFAQQLQEEPILFPLTPDMAKSANLRADQAGMLKIKLVVGQPEILNSANYRHANVTEMPKLGSLQVNLFNCQDLIPGDTDGKSDPFLAATYFGKTINTQCIEESLNPIYNERMFFEAVPIFQLDNNPPPLVIKCFDKDFIGSDFLGVVIVDLKEMRDKGHLKVNPQLGSKDPQQQPAPVWLEFNYGKLKNCGKLLVSFCLFDYYNEPFKAFINSIPKTISLPTENYHFKLRILGLRDLQSLGILPVKNAFIKFDINSLLPAHKKMALEDKKFIVTQPKESGSNPNISTIIDFDVELPVDLNFCPHLSVLVFDRILRGLSQPILGTFSINLPEYIEKTKKQLQFKIKSAREFLLENTKDQRKNLSNSLGFDVDEIIKNQKSPIVSKQVINIDNKQVDKDQSLHLFTNDNQLNMSQELLFKGDKGKASNTNMLNLQLGKKSPKNVDIFGQANKKERIVVIDPLDQLAHDGEISDPNSLVQFAKYVYNRKQRQVLEEQVPDEDKFLALSWDPKASRLGKKVNKHYRYMVETPLESTGFIDENTFDEFFIMRGSRTMKKGFFGGISEPENLRKVGKFKGWLEIISEKQKKTFKKELMGQLPGNIQTSNMSAGKQIVRLSASGDTSISRKRIKRSDIDSEFLKEQNVNVRVYILTADGLPAMDSDGLSDPYVIIKLGDQVINDSRNYHQNETNCEVYKMFEMKAKLPGVSQLHVQFWDKDNYVSDDLIGETIIDLENRFFSKIWRNLPYAPIETRNLYIPTSQVSRGRVQLFLEMSPSKKPSTSQDIWQISPKPSQPYELRVVVWDCEDCPAMDAEDVSDLFVTGTVGDNRQSTDVHYRSQTGNGSFNYRMIFPLSLPLQDPSITFSIWDKDILSPSDFISEGTLSFKQLADKAFANDSNVKLASNNALKTNALDALSSALPHDDKQSKEHVQKYTCALKNVEKTGYVAQKDLGKITITMELVPVSTATQNPVGKGRSEPNHSPWCPPPVGRFQFSMNPCTMLMNLVGPKARNKMCLLITILLFLIVFIQLFPVIIGQIIYAIL